MAAKAHRPPSDDASLRQVLKRIMEENEGSASSVCARTGLHSTSVYAFLRGDRGISWASLEVLMNHCGISFCSTRKPAARVPAGHRPVRTRAEAAPPAAKEKHRKSRKKG